ncbi:MAG: prolyl oligopeptidase family serine peptidase, partial [Myxococcota bacterium]
IAYQKNDERALEQFTITDAARPELPGHRFAYPRPGKANVDVRVFMVSADGGQHRELTWDREAYPYLAKVAWGGELIMLVQSRDQGSQILLRVDPQTGQTRTLFEERDPAWLNIHDSTPRFSEDARSFFWATEEGGAWRLERKHLADDGLSIVRRQVLVGEKTGFHTLVHIDEARGWLWFLGGQDPAQLHLFRASLDGSGNATQVTSGIAWHEASFAHGGEVIALTTTSLDQLPETTVHTVGPKGELTAGATLPIEAETPSRAPAVELRHADGLRAAVVRPEGFREDQKYPVILYVYGGPGVSLVRAQMAAWFVPQWLADHGFIVVSVDGRGTPRKGRDFERALKDRFHEVPLEDQVRGLEALARSIPQMDTDRVGVYGWSFGGYMSALSVLRRPDIFKAGVAGAPVVDWLYYDTHYTERYLGVPEDADDTTYRQGNLLTYAKDLDRPLLLVHGSADDNVYFAHTLQLADALFRAGRPFEMLPLVGLTHQVSDPTVREALFEWIVRFLGARLW